MACIMHRRPLSPPVRFAAKSPCHHKQSSLVMSGAENMLAIVHRKQEEIQRLLDQHSAPDDPLRMRLSYANSAGQYVLRTALRRHKELESNHQIAVIADVKRRTPTSVPHDLVGFDDAGQVCKQLRDFGCDALMVNTDGPAYGGTAKDLASAVTSVGGPGGIPVIMKDIIVHPLQLAIAAEQGANGAVLIAGVLGAALEDLMDTATVMGTEVIVEVHTPAECSKALEYGATVIMVNQWDRVTGKLYSNQAYGLRHLFPNEVLTIAAGGICSVDEVTRLADEGYDAVVLGRALANNQNPQYLINQIRSRIGLPRTLLGMGLNQT